jgi:hypothetical protein
MHRYLCAPLLSLTAHGQAYQAYPGKPICWIVPFPPAGTAEIPACIIGQKMTDTRPAAPEALTPRIHTDIQRGAKAVRISAATLNREKRIC